MPLNSIAIIGMACRFPGGVRTPEEYWQLLRSGRDGVTQIPADRWDVGAYFDPDPKAPGKMYTVHGGFLSDVDLFDPQLFGISPHEAPHIDPQQRLLLEVGWEALERAGQAPDELEGTSTGVFVGMCTDDYSVGRLYSGDCRNINPYNTLSAFRSIAAARLSYFFGCRGPAIQVDATCSSSLLAAHLACQSLRLGECDLALAGGVGLILSPEFTIGLCKLGALSYGGRCKTFDDGADGYVRGEGCGVIVLKRYQDALVDGDRILALFRGSAVNHDGRTRGLTAPSASAQRMLIQKALDNAAAEPAQIQYVEAHGTGTPLGDPIEALSLSSALRKGNLGKLPLMVGSVKTNLGHLEAASGVAGLMKVVLSLQHSEIPPNLHFRNPNHRIPWRRLPLVVPTEPTPWISHNGPRMAGVSSFGMSGTNVHVILQEAPPPDLKPRRRPIANGRRNQNDSSDFIAERPAHLLTLSAKTPDALQQLASDYLNHLAGNANLDLADICFTANSGRAHLEHRLAVIAADGTQVKSKLTAYLRGETAIDGFFAQTLNGVRSASVAFLFPDSGPQGNGMARRLCQTQPLFREVMERCTQQLRSCLDSDLGATRSPATESLDSEPSSHGRSGSLDRNLVQIEPALFALQYSLACLWDSWGITPAFVMGCGIGEYAAACIAGVLRLEEATALVAARTRFLGAMTSLRAPLDQLEASKLFPPAISTGGGSADLLEFFDGKRRSGPAKNRGQLPDGSRPEDTQAPCVLRALEAFEEIAESVRFCPPRVKFVSSLTGKFAAQEILNPDYWHPLREWSVRPLDAVRSLVQAGCGTVLEINADPVLLPTVLHAFSDVKSVQWLPALRSDREDWEQILENLAKLYVGGLRVNWKSFERGHVRRRVALPTYPFQRQRYWTETNRPQTGACAKGECRNGTHPFLAQRIPLPGSEENRFQFSLNDAVLRYFKDHRLDQTVIFPAAGFLEFALAAGAEVLRSEQLVLEGVKFQSPLFVSEKHETILQLVLSPNGIDARSFQIFSMEQRGGGEQGSWTLHASGRLFRGQEDRSVPNIDLKGIEPKPSEIVSAESYYEGLRQRGLEYGPAFRSIVRLCNRNGAVVGEVRLPEHLADDAGPYFFHPAVLDGCFQVCGACLPLEDWNGCPIPTGLDRMKIYRRGGTDLRSLVHVSSAPKADPAAVRVDLRFAQSDGAVVAELDGLELRPAFRSSARDQEDRGDVFYRIEWQPKVSSTETETEGIEAGSWLILADREGLGKRLAKGLQERGQDCFLAFAGPRYQELFDREIQVSPTQRHDFACLLKDATAAPNPPLRGILHLWSMDLPAMDERSSLDVFNTACEIGCESVLNLIQAMDEARLKETPVVTLVTRGAVAVPGDKGCVSLAQSPLWGLGKTIAEELPQLRCRRVDLSPEPTSDEWQQLLHEVQSESPETDVAFRNRVRYVQSLRTHLPLRAAERVGGFDPDGTYLITGGLGALGLLVAEWMKEKGVRHLVLAGRSEPPASIRSRINAIEESGAQLVVLQADVSLEQDVRRMLATIDSALPPLRGIVHAAGITDDAALLRQNPDRFRTVMAPKIAGAWLLHSLTSHLDLDLFVCFSSVAALFGSAGQSNYAAANAFLDALAQHRRARGLKGLSINWGPWEAMGMTSNLTESARRSMARRGLGFLSRSAGLRALEEILFEPCAQVAVVAFNWPNLLEAFPPGSEPPLFTALIQGKQMARPTERQSGGESKAERERSRILELRNQESLVPYLREVAAKILGLENSQLDLTQPLNYLGLDSIMALELRNRLSRDLGLDVPMIKIMDHQSVNDLADSLRGPVRSHNSDGMSEAENAPFAATKSLSNKKELRLSTLNPQEAAELLDKLDDLTDEEIDTILDSRFPEGDEGK